MGVDGKESGLDGRILFFLFIPLTLITCRVFRRCYGVVGLVLNPDGV